MDEKQSTVSDIFRRAQVMRQEHSDWTNKELTAAVAREYAGQPFPPLYNLAIPEQDARAPEEDWSAGLPLVRRGIQFQDWTEVARGIVLSLEQTENYEQQRGAEGDRDDWHDRSKGIDDAVGKAVGKWMPDELKVLVNSQNKK